MDVTEIFRDCKHIALHGTGVCKGLLTFLVKQFRRFNPDMEIYFFAFRPLSHKHFSSTQSSESVKFINMNDLQDINFFQKLRSQTQRKKLLVVEEGTSYEKVDFDVLKDFMKTCHFYNISVLIATLKFEAWDDMNYIILGSRSSYNIEVAYHYMSKWYDTNRNALDLQKFASNKVKYCAVGNVYTGQIKDYDFHKPRQLWKRLMLIYFIRYKLAHVAPDLGRLIQRYVA